MDSEAIRGILTTANEQPLTDYDDLPSVEFVYKCKNWLAKHKQEIDPEQAKGMLIRELGIYKETIEEIGSDWAAILEYNEDILEVSVDMPSAWIRQKIFTLKNGDLLISDGYDGSWYAEPPSFYLLPDKASADMPQI